MVRAEAPRGRGVLGRPVLRFQVHDGLLQVFHCDVEDGQEDGIRRWHEGRILRLGGLA